MVNLYSYGSAGIVSDKGFQIRSDGIDYSRLLEVKENRYLTSNTLLFYWQDGSFSVLSASEERKKPKYYAEAVNRLLEPEYFHDVVKAVEKRDERSLSQIFDEAEIIEELKRPLKEMLLEKPVNEIIW